MGWVILTYQLPGDRSRARVAVWREVRRSGALHLQQSVVAFPDTEEFRRAVERFRALVADTGGTTLALRAEPLTSPDGRHLLESWNEARTDEYAELRSECEKFIAEIEREFKKGKFTLAELEEEEAELDKLQGWHQRIKGRDVHAAAGAPEADDLLKRAADELGRYATAVFERPAQ